MGIKEFGWSNNLQIKVVTSHNNKFVKQSKDGQ